MNEQRVEQWESRTEWPLAAAALAFLGAYAWPILDPNVSAAFRHLCTIVVDVAWVVFLADYVARFVLARRRGRFVVRHLLDLAIVALPVLRPLRLLRLLFLLQGNLFDADCPTRLLLDRVGSKWTVMVVLQLAASDEVRFGALRRAVPGVSQKMLTQTLRQLEADGLVRRRVEPISPPAVHYSLTTLGDTLVAPLRELKHWAEDNMYAVELAQGESRRG